MKKFIIILISIFLLLSSFALGFFVKKQIDDKRIDSLNLTKIMLENKNEKYAEEIISLGKTVKRLKALKSNNLEKLTEDIYFEKNSVTKDKNSIKGWFKMYNSEDTYTDTVDGIPVFYELNQYQAYCESNVLCLIHLKKFDKDGSLLTEESNDYNICPSYHGFVNGDIYYNALCGYKK